MICQHTYTRVFEIHKNGESYGVWAGSKTDLEDFLVAGHRPWMVIDLSNSTISYEPTPISLTPPGQLTKKNNLAHAGDSIGDYIYTQHAQLITQFKAVQELSQFTHYTLKIDWPDARIPTYSQLFWTHLHAFLVEHITGDLFVHCMGGHGRTGTFLAILAALSRAHGDTNPVTFLRDRYCQEVVETSTQIWYIEQITGIDCSAITTPHAARAVPGWGYEPAPALPSVRAVPKPVPSCVVMEIDKSLYDDLNWDGVVNGYVDSDGQFIGATLQVAVQTLRERKAKA